jgi:aquaporin Z
MSMGIVENKNDAKEVEPLKLLRPWERDFENPRLETRRLFSEGLGTFFLVLVAAGGSVINALSGGAISDAAVVAAPGLMVMTVILFMGKVGGAHLNPVVSIAFAARGDFPWRRVPGYIVAQVMGAVLASLFLFWLFGSAISLGGTLPGPMFNDEQAFAIEFITTLGLVSTILGTASKAQNVGSFSAIAVGGYIALAGIWASPVSGASMNPARSFGPAVVILNFNHYWLYLAGPVLGGLFAVVCAYMLRGPGGHTESIRAAQGELE